MNKKIFLETENRMSQRRKLWGKKRKNRRKNAGQRIVPYDCVFTDASVYDSSKMSVIAYLRVDEDGIGYPHTMRIQSHDIDEAEDAAVEWARMHHPEARIYCDNASVVRKRTDPLVMWVPREHNAADAYSRLRSAKGQKMYEEVHYSITYWERP